MMIKIWGLERLGTRLCYGKCLKILPPPPPLPSPLPLIGHCVHIVALKYIFGDTE